jgi:hypothetical protein
MSISPSSGAQGSSTPMVSGGQQDDDEPCSTVAELHRWMKVVMSGFGSKLDGMESGLQTLTNAVQELEVLGFLSGTWHVLNI